jgi:mannitol-1-phosphate/altronate dehydrogenase
MGYLAARKGYRFMSEAADDQPLMKLAREAFLEESGAALIARHQGLDPLFTPAGYQAYADDLLARMTNPYLRDRTERVIRDTPRKLGWDDRLVGTMRVALDAGVTPHRFALGAAAALETLPAKLVGTRSTASVTLPAENGTRWNASLPDSALSALWSAPDKPAGRKAQLIHLITEAQVQLRAKQS